MDKPSNSILIFTLSLLLLTTGVLAEHQIIYNGSDIYIIPVGVPHTETLIYLHGVGGSAQGLLPAFSDEAKMIGKNSTKVVLLTAPFARVTILGKETHSWFDIYTLNVSTEIGLKDTISYHDIIKSSVRVQQIMNDEIKLLRGDSTKLFIGGQSQGCIMSLYIGFTFNQTLGGVIANSGYLVMIPRLSGPNTNIPLFISHGKDDQVVWFDLAARIYEDRLSPLQHKMTKIYEDGVGHEVTPNVWAKARAWFIDQTKAKTYFRHIDN